MGQKCRYMNGKIVSLRVCHCVGNFVYTNLGAKSSNTVYRVMSLVACGQEACWLEGLLINPRTLMEVD